MAPAGRILGLAVSARVFAACGGVRHAWLPVTDMGKVVFWQEHGVSSAPWPEADISTVPPPSDRENLP